jgi:hypothetical protein
MDGLILLIRCYSAATVEPERKSTSVAEMYAGMDLTGVWPLHETTAPASWNNWVRSQARENGLHGAFAILTLRPSPNDPESNHRMEVVSL